MVLIVLFLLSLQYAYAVLPEVSIPLNTSETPLEKHVHSYALDPETQAEPMVALGQFPEGMLKTAPASQSFLVPGTHSFTVPAGVVSIRVQVYGAGGGGGFSTHSSNRAAGGGGGAYAESTIQVVAGTTFTIIVGRGGTGANQNEELNSGGPSSFRQGITDLVMAAGGRGVASNGTAGATGGSAVSSIGNIRWSGGRGGNRDGSYTGGGGGGAGSFEIGGDANLQTPGVGGRNGGGTGGAGRSSQGVGSNGAGFGGGGGGARNNTGGAGGNGAVILTFYITCNIGPLNFAGSSHTPVFNPQSGLFYLDVCQNQQITLQAAANCTNCDTTPSFAWSVSSPFAGSTHHSNPFNYNITSPTVYDANLRISSSNCFLDVPVRIRASAGPRIVSVAEQLTCIGLETPVTAGTLPGNDIVAVPFTGPERFSKGRNQTTFIPDGVHCEGCYTSSVNITEFAPGQTIQSVLDILFLRINLEHSFIGDLQITLTGPNNCGSIIILQDFLNIASGGYDNFTYPWPYIVNSRYQMIVFGQANIGDRQYGGTAQHCNSSMWYNAPGTGATYAWTSNPNFQFAGGSGFVYEPINHTIHPDAPNYRVRPSNIASGTNFYRPFQGFENLIGCPLNGTWTIRVCDGFAIDNGYIFEWEMAFNSEIVPDNYWYTPELSQIQWVPNSNLQLRQISTGPTFEYGITPLISLTPGTFQSTFTVVDQFGCASPQATMQVHVQGVPPIAGIAAGDFVWAGHESKVWNTDSANVQNWLMLTHTGYAHAANLPTLGTNVYITGFCRARHMPEVTAPAFTNNLTILDGSLTVVNSQILSVRGHFENRGIFNHGNGRVVFMGNTLQHINAGASNLFNVTVNNSGAGLRLFNTLRLDGTLTLTRGLVHTQHHFVDVLNLHPDAVSIGNRHSYIFGNLRRSFSPTSGTYNLPVGTATAYRLAQVVNHSLTGVSFLEARFTDTFSNTGLLNPVSASDLGTAYIAVAPEGIWHISPNLPPTGGAYTIRLWFDGGGASAFSNISDNRFGVLRRPGGATTASSWSGASGGGTVSPESTPGRTLAGGFASRNNLQAFSEFAIAFSDSPLPVELLSFTADYHNGKVLLFWSTASETNNHFFSIERSLDAKNFTTIGTVPGAGFSNRTLQYSFTDPFPLHGIAYYRLKQTDFDGSYEHSEWVSVNTSETTSHLKLFPVVRQNEILLRIFSESKARISIQLYDLNGRLLYSAEAHPDNLGEYHHLIPIWGDSGRVFIIKLSDGREILTRKVIR